MDKKDVGSENTFSMEKRKLLENDVDGKAKKVKKFSAREFRKSLNKDNRLEGTLKPFIMCYKYYLNMQSKYLIYLKTYIHFFSALSSFLNVIKEKTKHDYILEYLSSGGSCLELLQTLEIDSLVPPVLVFELVTHMLLEIKGKHHSYQSAAFEACRYILNNYIAVVNKMISISSTTSERKVCLNLLSAIVSFSSNLAKDVLLNISIHSTNLELLTKQTGEPNSVREHFIQFLTRFLVDGHYPALSMLLEKKGFITSIIPGLKFDSAFTVCIVITAMKSHVLENPLVSKTVKMKTFNTTVVRDIVNLYNWKGPEVLKAQKKNKDVSVVVSEFVIIFYSTLTT